MSSFGDKKNMQAVPGRPRLGSTKCFLPQSGTVPDFLVKKKINQFQLSITFFPDHFLKKLNGKNLDFYLLKGLDDVYAWVNVFLYRCIFPNIPKNGPFNP